MFYVYKRSVFHPYGVKQTNTHTRGSFLSMLWLLLVQEALDDRMHRKMFICRQSESCINATALNQQGSFYQPDNKSRASVAGPFPEATPAAPMTSL